MWCVVIVLWDTIKTSPAPFWSHRFLWIVEVHFDPGVSGIWYGEGSPDTRWGGGLESVINTNTEAKTFSKTQFRLYETMLSSDTMLLAPNYPRASYWSSFPRKTIGCEGTNEINHWNPSWNIDIEPILCRDHDTKCLGRVWSHETQSGRRSRFSGFWTSKMIRFEGTGLREMAQQTIRMIFLDRDFYRISLWNIHLSDRTAPELAFL